MSLKGMVQHLNAYFALNWARIPFQPILYTFLFIGALLILFFDVNYPAFEHNASVLWQWVGLSLLCPPLALTSWILIRWYPGRPRYMGFWLRGGADGGQLASVSAFLAAISQQVDYVASELYAVEIFTAVWWFLVVLVIRDIWKIIVTERVASVLEERKDADLEVRDDME